MKSVLYYGPEEIKLEEQAIPELKADEILVKVEAALTGGTDIKTYLRGHPRIIKSIPSSFGYEFAGKVAQSENPKFKTGDRIVSANTAPCFDCFFCKKEEFELCENLDFLNGSFSEYIKIPAQIAKHNSYKIPDQLSYKEAACTQTLAVALHGFYKSQIKTGDTVVIYGLGAIGQSFIKLCKNYAQDLTVIAIGRSEMKMQLAKENGADHVVKDGDSIKELIPYGADVVIEAVGKAETWTKALGYVRPGGLVNFFGGCPKGTTIELDTFQAHYQELRTVGVFHHQPKYIKKALELIAIGTIDMNNLISHEMPLDQLEKALLMMQSGEAMKVAIVPSLRGE